nr:MAG TPA: hypothetical protein [Caudoviricetes sp.]
MLLLFADFVLAIQGQQFLLMYLLLLFPLYHSIPTLISTVRQSPFNGTAAVILLIVWVLVRLWQFVQDFLFCQANNQSNNQTNLPFS